MVLVEVKQIYNSYVPKTPAVKALYNRTFILTEMERESRNFESISSENQLLDQHRIGKEFFRELRIQRIDSSYDESILN